MIYDTNNFLIESIISGIEDAKYNYSYNNRGLLAELIYFENDFMIEKIIFEYDSNDNLISQVNIPLTQKIEYSYDNNNFLTEIIMTIFEDNPQKYKKELKYNKE